MIFGRGGGGGRPLVLVRCSGPGVYGGGCSFEPSYSFVLRSVFKTPSIKCLLSQVREEQNLKSGFVGSSSQVGGSGVIAGMFHIILGGYLYMDIYTRLHSPSLNDTTKRLRRSVS